MDKNQLSLPFEIDPVTAQKQEERFEQARIKERTKKESSHKGRMPLSDHFPVEKIKNLSTRGFKVFNLNRAITLNNTL